jgi:hypothetical protein
MLTIGTTYRDVDLTSVRSGSTVLNRCRRQKLEAGRVQRFCYLERALGSLRANEAGEAGSRHHRISD